MNWIDVETAVPPSFEDVLCYCVNVSGETYEKGEGYISIDSFIVWNDGYLPGFRADRFFGKVTHWMRLPCPPISEEDRAKVTITKEKWKAK